MLPAVLGALSLLASLGYIAYDEGVGNPRRERAEKRTRRSEATARGLEEYLLQGEERRAEDINRSMAIQRERAVLDEVGQRQLQDPTGLGMTRMELEQIQAIAYRPRPSPAEILTYFGVGA